MASTRKPVQHDFFLTPQQQSLLLAALNSNQPTNRQPDAAMTHSLAKTSNGQLPQRSDQQSNDADKLQESPLFDYEYSFEGPDSSFDFSFDSDVNGTLMGDLPNGPATSNSDSPQSENQDKRRHSEDDDEEESGDVKRRERDEKISKKAGRKPLTTEPTSKRKAQNRAAQRAFRERKEKHLKELETKVQELEKASEAANNENENLRSKIDKMTVELTEYKKRVSIMTSLQAKTQASSQQLFGQPFSSNLNDVKFQFEFPQFGQSPSQKATFSKKQRASVVPPTKCSDSGRLSPTERPDDGLSPSGLSTCSQTGVNRQIKENVKYYAASLFNPDVTSSNFSKMSRASLDSHCSFSASTTVSSPASPNSIGGPSSSCGTSPEPLTLSPKVFKPVDTLATIGEEHSTLSSSDQDYDYFVGSNVNFNWLPQSDFQFDPAVFGDYRDPNVSGGGVDDNFFNDAFDLDFTIPYNLPKDLAASAVQKPDLIALIDAAKDADEPANKSNQLLTCHKIWEQLQSCPKVQSGDFDLDGLCSDLQKKAKCSGSGAVVDERDFKTVMQKYLSKDDLRRAY